MQVQGTATGSGRRDAPGQVQGRNPACGVEASDRSFPFCLDLSEWPHFVTCFLGKQAKKQAKKQVSIRGMQVRGLPERCRTISNNMDPSIFFSPHVCRLTYPAGRFFQGSRLRWLHLKGGCQNYWYQPYATKHTAKKLTTVPKRIKAEAGID